MQNRRQHYRHEFGATHLRTVRLSAADGQPAVTADLVNLSIGGMCVYSSALQNEPGDQWLATLTLDGVAEPIAIPVKRVFARGDRPCFFGLRFMGIGDAHAAEERERLIWKFLLTEQRQRRRLA